MSSLKELIKGFSPKGIAEGTITTVLEKGADIADRFITTGAEKEEFAQAWAKLQQESEEMYLKDVQSARSSEVAKVTSDKTPFIIKLVPYLIDMFIMVVWGFLTVYLISRAFKVTETEIDISLIMGIWAGVTGLATTVLNFHRGSSQGSADKQKELGKFIKG